MILFQTTSARHCNNQESKSDHRLLPNSPKVFLSTVFQFVSNNLVYMLAWRRGTASHYCLNCLHHRKKHFFKKVMNGYCTLFYHQTLMTFEDFLPNLFKYMTFSRQLRFPTQIQVFSVFLTVVTLKKLKILSFSHF